MLQCVRTRAGLEQTRRRGRPSADSARPRPREFAARAQRVGLVAHLARAPSEIDSCRPRAGEHVVRRVEILPALAASAKPYAAAIPIAGAPRMASVRIASATSAAEWQRSSTSSSGSRRWSSTTTASALEPDDVARVPAAAASSASPSDPVCEEPTGTELRPEPGSARREAMRSSSMSRGEGGGSWGNHWFPTLTRSLRPRRTGTWPAPPSAVDRDAHRGELQPAISSSISCGTT